MIGKNIFAFAQKTKTVVACTVLILLVSVGMDFAQQGQAVPVSVATAIQKDAPIQIRTFGNVETISSVSIKSKVDGELMKVFFQEGQDIREGDPLFLIDPRPYEEALNQAKANLARDISLAENAAAEQKRYESLYKDGIVSKELYDQAHSNSEAQNASVEADKAALETARLNLEYCSISSPITGRAGGLLITRGNLVKSNDVPLVVINQIQPIYVDFVVPEQYFTEISRRMAQGKLKVEAIVPNEKDHPVEGTLTFLNNQVDQQTGTVLLKATFPNKEKLLWPGQFVNVTLTYGMRPNAVIVPTQALQSGQQGTFVYVVKQDLTVEMRPVVTGMAVNEDTVIEKGISAGERVVTDGQLRLVPGARVEIKAAP